MLKLIQMECKKIFHKKSIFVIFGIIVIFCFLNNFLYWIDYDEEGRYKYENKDNLIKERANLEEELEKYNVENSSDISMYLSLKTKIDLLTIKEKYDANSWQYQKANDYLYDVVYQVNYDTYIEKEKQVLESSTANYLEKLNKFKQDDWQYFINNTKQKKEEEAEKLKQSAKLVVDKMEQEELQRQLLEIEAEGKILEYRLKKNIKEDTGYLNQALTKYQKNWKVVDIYQNKNESLSYEEEVEYQKALSNVAVSKYIMDHQVNINQQNNLSYQLRTITEDYEIFIVIIILMITGTIFCEEFHKGTIKLLLIKPYSRVKILLSKYFTCVVILFLTIIFLIIIQLLFGSIFFGLDSLSMPVVVYQYHTKVLMEYSIFSYMIIQILAQLPFFLMLLTISFGIGVTCSNTAVTITIPLLLYMFAPSLHYLAVQYHLTFMRYFITINWSFKEYLFGARPEFSEITCKFSSIIWAIYFVAIALLTIVSFQKKDIKNI